MEHKPFRDPEIAFKTLLQCRVKFIKCNFGKKTEATEIDTEYRNISLTDCSGGRYESPVAAKDNNHVGTGRYIGSSNTRTVKMAGQVGLYQRFATPLLKPAEKLPGNPLTAWIMNLCEYSNSFHRDNPLRHYRCK